MYEPLSAVLASVDLLQAILANVEQHELRATAPLVCRGFAAALASPGACWRQLSVDGLLQDPPLEDAADAHLFWARLAAWVAPRAAGMRTLRLTNLRYLLLPLGQAGRHAALAAVWSALSPPVGLHTLELGRSSITLAPGTVASLGCLTALRRLCLHTSGPVDTAELDALADSLPQLEALSICLLRRRGQHSVFRGPFPGRLTRLRRLRTLHLEAPYGPIHGATCVLPDSIAEWGRQMEELHLINLGLERIPPSIGKLGSLRELLLGRNRLGAQLDALPQELTQLTALTLLELQYNGFEAGAPAVVGELTSLQGLNLGGNLWGSAAADLPREFSQLTQLRHLTLTNTELTVLPPVVCGLSRLELLRLNINQLQTLPGGPYLRSLKTLDLSHNRFAAGYPAALAGATHLQLIAFQFRGTHYSDPVVALREAMAPQAAAAPAPAHAGPLAVAAAVVLPPELLPGEAMAMED